MTATQQPFPSSLGYKQTKSPATVSVPFTELLKQIVGFKISCSNKPFSLQGAAVLFVLVTLSKKVLLHILLTIHIKVIEVAS